jgi:hypothetical protein
MSAGDRTITKETVSISVQPELQFLTDEADNRIIDDNDAFIIGGWTDQIIDVDVGVVSDGNVPGLIGERSYRCVKCGFSYKESNIQMFRGKPYCVPMGCYKDIQSILFEENCDRIRARARSRSAEMVQHFLEGV